MMVAANVGFCDTTGEAGGVKAETGEVKVEPGEDVTWFPPPSLSPPDFIFTSPIKAVSEENDSFFSSSLMGEGFFFGGGIANFLGAPAKDLPAKLFASHN